MSALAGRLGCLDARQRAFEPLVEEQDVRAAPLEGLQAVRTVGDDVQSPALEREEQREHVGHRRVVVAHQQATRWDRAVRRKPGRSGIRLRAGPRASGPERCHVHGVPIPPMPKRSLLVLADLGDHLVEALELLLLLLGPRRRLLGA